MASATSVSSTTPADGARMQINPRRTWKLVFSYAPDWIITIALTGLFYGIARVPGFRRDFSLTDTSIQYHYTENERVPPYALVLISLVAPGVIMPLINLISIRSWWDWHNSWLGLVLSWGLTGTITNIVKITTGRPRPDMLSRCLPAPGSMNPPVFGLVGSEICTQTDVRVLRDGFRSFFSGHSSLSFAGLGFLFFYMAGKLHLFDERGHAGKAWISAVPLMGAALVAISRTMDYRHHWGDVLVGAIAGLAISHFAYRQYFPPLAHPLSHRPYSPRIPRQVPVAEQPNKDVVATTAAPAEGGSLRRRPVTSEPGPGGSVLRQDPELSDVWREGGDGEGDTVPRSGNVAV